MLKMAGLRASRDRPSAPLPGRRRRPELCRQRTAPARGALRGDLDPAGRRRRGGRARRRAGDLAPVPRQGAPKPGVPRHVGAGGEEDRPRRPIRRRHEGGAPRAQRTTSARSSAFLDAMRAPYRRVPREALAEEIATLLVEEKVVGLHQGRMEFGPRALGCAEHSRRSPVSPDAVGHEPQDQVPGELPPVRPVGAARARRGVVRARPRQPVHAARGRRGPAPAPRDDAGGAGPLGDRQAERRALGDPRRDARGLLRARPDRAPRGEPALLGHPRGLSPQDRLLGRRQHELQRARRADRLHARRTATAASGARRWTRSCSRTSSSGRRISRRSKRRGTGARSSSSTEGGYGVSVAIAPGRRRETPALHFGGDDTGDDPMPGGIGMSVGRLLDRAGRRGPGSPGAREAHPRRGSP